VTWIPEACNLKVEGPGLDCGDKIHLVELSEQVCACTTTFAAGEEMVVMQTLTPPDAE